MFAAPSASAAASVGVSANGTSACFVGTAERGVKSTVAIAPGASSFYYFEARRSTLVGVAFGVSESAAEAPALGTTFMPQRDTLVVRNGAIQSVDSAGMTQSTSAGDGEVFGFAVDYRAPYPIVNVIGPASVNPGACAPLTGSAACVLMRWQLTVPAATLSIYAHGSGNGTDGPRVTINTGSDLAARPFAYSTPAVMAALRANRIYGDRQFNAQWPGPSGPAVVPELTRMGHERAVIRKGDATPYRASLAVTPADADGGTIKWRDGKDETSALLGTGASLPLVGAPLIDGLSAGEHTLTASVLNSTTGRYADVSFRLLVLLAATDGDDDGDGLTYSQEKALGTDPGNADTDGDGLSDGAEAGLLTDPTRADSDGNGINDGYQLAGDSTLPLLGKLVIEPGVTSRGLVLSEDNYSVIFTDQLNPECVQHQGVFAADVYFYRRQDGTLDGEERCRKRAVRANAGIKKGEFRYFEAQRLGPDLENVGIGIITASGRIDPYCCFVEPGQPGDPYTGTPPSLAINPVGGVFLNLNYEGGTFNPPFDLDATRYYGFAVDYAGTDPKVYLVVSAMDGSMTVSEGITVAGFMDGPVMPMLYGHPNSNTDPRLSINLGLQRFHYDLSAIRSALTAKSVDLTNFRPGVGIHRWQ
jgi:hypothetical protein